jgi:FKBP-type peptidyl-prolyl cis-trans isomerase FkpA
LYKEIFKKVHVGDSIIIKVSTDSIMAKGPAAPWMKAKKIIVQSYTITNSYATQAEADKARTAAIPVAEAIAKKKNEELIKKDEKTLTDYFAKNNIKATKTAGGTFVEIIQPGTGPNLDTAIVAQVNYTGKLLNGTISFDSNTDPAKGHVGPFNVNLTNDASLGQPVIQGWKDGLMALNKGAKAKFYIPSSLGYGAQGQGEEIPPNSILVFDIEVLNVLSKAQAKIDIEAKSKAFQDAQKKYIDSMKKANPAPAAGAPGTR